VKRVEAVIQPHKLEAVKEALDAASITGLMVTEIRGHGRQKGHTEIYRGQEYKVDMLPKIKVETVIPDARLEEVLTIISDAARSGKIGDGKIFVSDVIEAIRIRNGDRGDAAL
jgi:nitrogen regulatory protein P-II 1